MEVNIKKEKTCCFTGHRVIDKNQIESLYKKLDRTVEGFISAGITTFLAGGALGFDTLAALTVLDKREKYPNVRLIICIPCPDQSRSWSERDRAIYDGILSRADGTVLVSDRYFKGCMHLRNRYMADNSQYCIAYCLDENGKSGSAYTLNYAKKVGDRTINLALIPN